MLCCPGCFSLYRIDALRDCLLQYSSGVNEAFDFLTKDMGEDRWLCTLLVMAGWRLDYSAVATNTTYVPESFDEFFNQRRRWIVSTLANQVELLSNWRVAVRMNDSVSITFVLYQVRPTRPICSPYDPRPFMTRHMTLGPLTRPL